MLLTLHSMCFCVCFRRRRYLRAEHLSAVAATGMHTDTLPAELDAQGRYAARPTRRSMLQRLQLAWATLLGQDGAADALQSQQVQAVAQRQLLADEIAWRLHPGSQVAFTRAHTHAEPHQQQQQGRQRGLRQSTHHRGHGVHNKRPRGVQAGHVPEGEHYMISP